MIYLMILVMILVAVGLAMPTHTIQASWSGTNGKSIPSSFAVTGLTEINSDFTIANYVFTLSATGSATAGATFTNNGNTFTVLQTIASGLVLLCTGTGAPTASGTLTLASGTGSSTLSFAAVNTGYLFTCSSANATVGATYTNSAETFVVLATIAAGTALICAGTGAPGASGTLTKASGTGDATITFSAEAASTYLQAELYELPYLTMQSLWALSSAPMAVLVNGVASPAATLSLVPGAPFEWNVQMGIANPFSANLATLFFPVGTTATVNVRGLTN